MKDTIKNVVSKRTLIQVVIGVSIYAGIQYFNISLWYVVGAGAVIGVIFGKVFCRWMCPLGFVMELLTGMNPKGKFQQMYMYHKIGCPIAWIEGFLNKTSLFQIKFNAETCKNCGICDKNCYIATIEPAKYSLYKPGKETPGQSYTCSKCLSCVAACPNGSLKYTAKL
ncbi:MAG: 4Fe-4S binding protein [Bacteroidales bacterium]